MKYLHAIKSYVEEGRPIVYTDETYIYSSHTSSYEWDGGSGTDLKAPVSKGPHPSIVHSGNTCTQLYLNLHSAHCYPHFESENMALY